jgi:DNA mismatch repair protein MutS2
MSPGGEIRSDASETLYNLHREKGAQTRAVQNALDRLVKQHEMEPVLQEKYVTTREGRWVLPVKGGMQHHFPGIIHASSASKQTVFMEPDDVVPLNNRLRQIDADIEAEIERLLTQLSQYLAAQAGDFERARDAMLEADIRFAQAKLAEILDASPCRFSRESLELVDVRHPLLTLKNGKVVSNTVRLAASKRILLLSGPNAGGKTVLLKAVGLAAHMARCGLPICAEEGSKLPFFENLFIGVGDAQSVGSDLSTFAAHLKVLGDATHAKGASQLLLIDEICGATDPEEGSALARSFIERYAKNQVFAVITSHMGPLKAGWDPGAGIVNGSLEYDAANGRPTYQFLMGVPGQSLALVTARRVGVDGDIVERALEWLSPEAKEQQRHLADIESLKEDLQRLRQEVFEEAKEAREKKRKYTEMIQRFRQERDQWLERSVKKAERKLDEMVEKAQVEQIFRNHEKLQNIKSEMPEVVKSSGLAQAARKKIETAEDFERVYPPGSMIFIPSVGHEGVIQGKANAKGEVPVLSNSMRLFVSWQSLRAPQTLQNPTNQIVRRSSGVTVTLQDAERAIDLRGQGTDDAIARLESQLDAAALAGEDRVKIIHGHGTEALKRAIRAHLSRSIYVKKWKAAPPEGGGDGVTFAELKD